jgi:hypothetical protein
MTTTKSTQIPFITTFTTQFRKQIHQLIAWGFTDARHRIQSNDEQEPAITGFIAEAIKDRLRALDCPRWCCHYFVRDDLPVEKEGLAGRDRPRPDIIIETNFPGRPEYLFEAKRLRKYGFTASKYASPDGIGCFVTGLYAARYDEAAMLGYIQSDSLAHWQNEVKSAIDNDGSELRLKSPQRDVRIIEALPLEWVSEHERDGVARPIIIYHILLDCCCQT